jgi:hypothetical protein
MFIIPSYRDSHIVGSRLPSRRKTAVSESGNQAGGTLTHRERVLITLDHRVPDRVALDLGAHDSTGIAAIAYNRLKDYLAVGGRTLV